MSLHPYISLDVPLFLPGVAQGLRARLPVTLGAWRLPRSTRPAPRDLEQVHHTCMQEWARICVLHMHVECAYMCLVLCVRAHVNVCLCACMYCVCMCMCEYACVCLAPPRPSSQAQGLSLDPPESRAYGAAWVHVVVRNAGL